ncbi:PASTA domain-containing protein, partial [Clostridium perfringens]
DYYDDDFEEDYDDDDFEDEDDFSNKKKNKNKNGIKKALITIGIIIAVLILGSVGFFLASGKGSSKEVEVPNIVGKTVDEAKSELSKLGLQIEVTSTDKSDKPKNTILEVEPKVGTKIKKNTSVKVKVSGGEEKIKMPDFRQYEVTDIKQYLDSEGLKNYNIKEEFS